jgi:LmbE family N-acetylglucosaminyl deacetylase
MRKVLVFGAHPDDIEFGCGGSLVSFSSKKYKIALYVATKGGAGGADKVREKEQNKSASIIGALLLWGSFRDTELFLNRELIDEVESVIKRTRPDMIFVNYYNDTHQDHVALSKAVITAARYSNNLLFYETPTSIGFQPNMFYDITGVLDKKLLLLKSHKSQLNKTRVKNLSIIESAKSTAVFRGYQARVKYAEAFISQRILLNLL